MTHNIAQLIETGQDAKIAALTAALAGMVRLHCTGSSNYVTVSCKEDMQAVRVLAQSGMIDIERNASHIVEGYWIVETEKPK